MKKTLYLFGLLVLAFNASMYSQAKKNEVIKDSVVDARDGHVYKMVKIGNKFWTVENLKWECEGSFIYENLPKNLKKHGRLYSYDASRNACPAGTHLPSKQEWDSLEKAVDPRENGDAGSKLIKKTNPGFAATLAGYQNNKGKFAGIENTGCYWGSDNAVSFSGDYSGVNFFINDKIDKKDIKSSYSIRCVKN
jgi:uncharacterized protein (TIGR02145 family)